MSNYYISQCCKVAKYISGQCTKCLGMSGLEAVIDNNPFDLGTPTVKGYETKYSNTGVYNTGYYEKVEINNKPKTLEDIMKEFDETVGTYTNEYGYVRNIPNYGKIKSFLTTIWHAGRESVVDEGIAIAEGMKKDNSHYANLLELGRKILDETERVMKMNEDMGYNSALSDVITKLSELKK